MDREHGQIDEVTGSGSRTVLSSLGATALIKAPIAGLGGLSVTKNAIWFTAGNGLYQASPSGRAVRRDGRAPGAVEIYALADGTIFFTTASAIFRRGPGRLTERVEGGQYRFSGVTGRATTRGARGHQPRKSRRGQPTILLLQQC